METKRATEITKILHALLAGAGLMSLMACNGGGGGGGNGGGGGGGAGGSSSSPERVEDVEVQAPQELLISTSQLNITISQEGLVHTSKALAVARKNPQAVTLDDGRVLVTGGKYASALFGTNYRKHSEIFTPPATNSTGLGSFARTGFMVTGRLQHSLVKLQNGDVLMVGGTNRSGSLGKAEYFDVADETWTALADDCDTGLTGGITLTLLNDGRVLALGGHSKNAEIYDPNNGPLGCFEATDSMEFSRGYASAVLLDNGTVLVISGGSSKKVEIYDPNNDTFSTVADEMNLGRSGAAVTKLTNGKVLIAGGSSGATYYNSAEIFDPATETFSDTGSTVKARTHGHAHTLTAGPLAGKVVLVGGWVKDDHEQGTRRVEIYDPRTETFSEIASQSGQYRGYSAVVALADGGRVMTLGGWTTGIVSTDIFNSWIGARNTFVTAGGTAPYTLAVTRGQGDIVDDIYVIEADEPTQGITVTVTDANGDTASTNFTVTAE